MADFVGIENGVRFAVLEWYGDDGIAVIVIQNQDVVAASAGWCHKFSSLVGKDLSCWFKHGSIAEVSAGLIDRC